MDKDPLKLFSTTRPVSEQRWTAKRKTRLAQAALDDGNRLDELSEAYGLSPVDLASWMTDFQENPNLLRVYGKHRRPQQRLYKTCRTRRKRLRET